MSMLKHFVIPLLSFVVAACSLSTGPDISHFGSGPRRVLFLGNSLTGFNDMPSMVVALAESAKVSPLPTAVVEWLPNYALIDHWADGQAQKVISDGHYDVVVMQQGPTSVGLNRDTLRLAAKNFNPIIRAAGGIPALYSVWPTIDRQQDFDQATQSYALAAQDVNGMHFPAGETWRAAWRRDPTLQFYSADGLHPSVLGSYAVALTILGGLYDRSVVGLPNAFVWSGGRFQVDANTARIIQEAADEANRNFGLKGSR
jgi:hypothetical protein